MRKVILQEFLSLDGLAAGADGSTDFIPEANSGDKSFMDGQLKMLEDIDTMILGRLTYEMFADYWPEAIHGDGEDKELEKIIGGLHKIVFSSTIERAPWGDQEPGVVIKGNAADELRKIKESPGKDIVLWGSVSLAQSLINGGLIDEVRLVTCPSVLGDGRPFFFKKVDALNLNLIGAKTFDRGSVELCYQPARAAATRTAQ